ncbi:MAG: hypothetical protein H7Y03_07510 [Chitinophagaceae bacterium]|nr:hypothetical protein [Chitinophagaceae bacterium]
MGLDSVELIIDIEKYFNIRIKDEDAEGLYTAGRVVDHVSHLLGVDDTNEQLLLGVGEKLALSCNSIYTPALMNEAIAAYINFKDENSVLAIQERLGLPIPYLSFRQPSQKKTWWKKFVPSTSWLDKDWTGVSVRNFLIGVLAHNLEGVIDKNNIRTTFEVYLAVVRITADKVGVYYDEVTWDASFTDDLGVD